MSQASASIPLFFIIVVICQGISDLMTRKVEIRHIPAFKVLGSILGGSLRANSGLDGTQRVSDVGDSNKK